MAFGWSFPKLMVFLCVAFLLVGVPTMAWIAAFLERRRRRAEGARGARTRDRQAAPGRGPLLGQRSDRKA